MLTIQELNELAVTASATASGEEGIAEAAMGVLLSQAATARCHADDHGAGHTGADAHRSFAKYIDALIAHAKQMRIDHAMGVAPTTQEILDQASTV